MPKPLMSPGVMNVAVAVPAAIAAAVAGRDVFVGGIVLCMWGFGTLMGQEMGRAEKANQGDDHRD